MSEAPIFPMPESQNFCDYDYGLDPQIDYFQHLVETERNIKRSQDTKSHINSVNLKIQKSIISDRKHKHHYHHRQRQSSAAGKWWQSAKSALQFWKRAQKKKKKNGRNNSTYSHSYSDSYSVLYTTEDYAPLHVMTCRSGIGCYYNLRELNKISYDIKTGGNGNGALPIYLVT